MRCPNRFRGVVVVALTLSLAAVSAACSSADSAETGAAGTTGDGPFEISFSQTYVTVENRTGVPIAESEMVIVPRGVMAPFRTSIGRIDGRRDVMFNNFRSIDGTPFRRGVTRTRTLRITATDITGRKLEQEVPFN